MAGLKTFSRAEIDIVNHAVSMAEDLVSNHFKMSASQWLRQKYDIKTLTDLSSEEVVEGPFAQIVRYVGRLKDASLGSLSYDFYKICIQDHAILTVLEAHPRIRLMPFGLYIIAHELIHVVRFIKFLQSFEASDEEKMAEETRVHRITHQILDPVHVEKMTPVFEFYQNWHKPLEGRQIPSENIA